MTDDTTAVVTWLPNLVLLAAAESSLARIQATIDLKSIEAPFAGVIGILVCAVMIILMAQERAKWFLAAMVMFARFSAARCRGPHHGTPPRSAP